jgi:hypothetical protein
MNHLIVHALRWPLCSNYLNVSWRKTARTHMQKHKEGKHSMNFDRIGKNKTASPPTNSQTNVRHLASVRRLPILYHRVMPLCTILRIEIHKSRDATSVWPLTMCAKMYTYVPIYWPLCSPSAPVPPIWCAPLSRSKPKKMRIPKH